MIDSLYSVSVFAGKLPATLTLSAVNWLRHRSTLAYGLVFTISFVLLFLGMDRGFDYYDEGVNLVGAMRVAAGQVPHRDFYANYGPGQFYVLAWLFDLFGSSVFVERTYDLFLRSAIVTVTYGITAAYCKPRVALATTAACFLWLFSASLATILYPIIPVLLLVLLSSILLLAATGGDKQTWRTLVAGGLTALVTLFRYDVGFALALVQIVFVWIAGFRENSVRRKGAVWPLLWRYALGFAVLFLPVALLYLLVAPLHPFVHDIILYPAKYYARARRLPFPGIRLRSLENLAVYLPVMVAILCFYAVMTARASGDGAKKQDRLGVLMLFGLLATAFYFKGLVRISVAQMLLSIVLTTIALAVLLDYSANDRPRLHRTAQWVMALSMFTAIWSGLKEIRVLLLSHESVLEELVRGPAAGCDAPNRLHTSLCFVVDPAHADAIAYLAKYSKPSETVFIGLSRHDRLVANDLLSYFVVDRLPATRWAHFDPDLQTRADIQSEMIRELDAQKVRYVMLESQFDSQVQPENDSSKSSGVTLLDDYIRRNYRLVETYGPISIWFRHVS